MTLYDLFEQANKEELTEILLALDSWLKYLHSRGLCVFDFNPKKIVLENGKLTFNSFKPILNKIDMGENLNQINIFQDCKIGIMAYNNMPVDGNMNQEHFNFLRDNLEKFNQNGQIPEDVYEYYEEVFRRLNIVYMNDYFEKKQELNGNQNTSVRKKSLSTAYGRAYIPDEAAYVNVLFIPSIIVLVYLIGLFIYTFVIK